MRPYITKKYCDCCKECIDLCPYDVFSDEGGEVMVTNPEDCIECLACVEGCPRTAISMGD